VRSTAFHDTTAPWNKKQGEQPVSVLYLDLPSGAAYYGERSWTSGAITVVDRVVRWETSLLTRTPDLQGGGLGPSGLQATIPSLSVVLRDDDKALWAEMRDRQMAGRTARVYLAAYGQQVDYFKVFEGAVSGRPVWSRGELRLTVSSGDEFLNDFVGNVADDSDFPDIYPDHSGRMLPICFGHPTRVPCVAVRHGRRGRFRADAGRTDTIMYIEGLEDSVGGNLVTLFAGRERFTGTFEGSKFNVTQRGGGVVASGQTTQASTVGLPQRLYVDPADCGTVDNAWLGYLCKMNVPGSPGAGEIGYGWGQPGLYGYAAIGLPSKAGDEHRYIFRYDATGDGTHAYLYIAPAFTYEHAADEDGRGIMPGEVMYFAGHTYVPPSGKAYEITTMAMPHRRGEEVWEVVDDGVVYVAADHRTKAVRAVWVRGKRTDIPVQRQREHVDALILYSGGIVGLPGRTAPAQGVEGEEDETEDWVLVPPELYTVDCNDTTTFAGLGRALTTIKFELPLPLIPGYEISSVEIAADLEAFSEDGSTVVENPVSALEDVLGTWASGVPLDAGSFSAAAASVDFLKVDFQLHDRKTVQELAADVAWQCRCRALWKDGELHVDYLRNTAPASHDVHVGYQVEEGGHEFQKRAIDHIITELEYKVRVKGEERTYTETDAGQVSTFGRRSDGRAHDFWLYEQQAYAQAVARFWLNRSKTEQLSVKARVPLTHVQAEVGDWARLYENTFFGDNTKYWEVVEVEHELGGAGGGAPVSPSVTVTLMEPYGFDDWTCPAGDACIGCDVYCEESANVLPCTVAADLGCDVYDLAGYADWKAASMRCQL
jgi:hypothetical protein